MGSALFAILAACQGGDHAGAGGADGTPDSAAVTANGGGARANGERIFRNATSRSKPPVRSTGQAQPDGTPLLSCGDCHGANGRGQSVSLAGRTMLAPDISYEALTRERADAGLPEYNEVTLGLTLRTGVTPDGRRLDPIMPRWQMSASDLHDLVVFLASLSPAADSVPGR